MPSFDKNGNLKRPKQMKVFSELSPQKQSFAEEYIKAVQDKGKLTPGDLAEVTLRAGYYKDHPDSEERAAKLYRMGIRLLNEKVLKEYIYMANPRQQRVDVDLNSVVDRLGLILAGNVEQKIFDSKGSVKYVPPNFREQVMAATALISIFKMQEKNAKPEDVVKTASKRLDDITDSIKKDFECIGEKEDFVEVIN